MPNFRRVRVPGATYFFTVNLMDRHSMILVDHIDVLRDAYCTMRREHPFHCDAIVILPDHIHAVWTLPEHDCDFGVQWGALNTFRPLAPFLDAPVTSICPSQERFKTSKNARRWLDGGCTAAGRKPAYEFRRFWEVFGLGLVFAHGHVPVSV
ncbi:MAG: transposase [Pseudomonadota bacterium]